jgi:hypothetical protein
MRQTQRQAHRNSRWITTWALTLVATFLVISCEEVSAATLYVSQTSANPSPPYATPGTAAHNVPEAVAAANDGDTVLVAPGQYSLTNPLAIVKAVILRSTMGTSQTFLNVDISTWGLSVSNSGAVIDGFTVQNPGGEANSSARGIELFGGTVQNCNFTNFFLTGGPASVAMVGGVLSNSIVVYGSLFGDSAVDCQGGGLITDCQILGVAPRRGNTAIGVNLVNSELRNSLIWGTVGAPEQQAGPAVNAVASTITGCTITHNFNDGSGGGAYLDSCLMDRCVVAYNYCASYGVPGSLGGGGVFAINSIIRTSLIVSNKVGGGSPDYAEGYGGGVYMQGGSLLNCTVAGNSAYDCPNPQIPAQQGQGAGVYAESGGITNSIIVGNFFFGCSNALNQWFNAGPAVFDHCCTTPNPGGAGNLTADPQFIDPANEDYHLASTSLCVGVGVVQPWMTGAFDLDGNPRATNGVVDLGAYQLIPANDLPPTKQALALMAMVADFVHQGVLSVGQGHRLNASLKAALAGMKSSEEDQSRPLPRQSRTADGSTLACNQISAFITLVVSYQDHGTLTQAQAQSLAVAAQKLSTALGCR